VNDYTLVASGTITAQQFSGGDSDVTACDVTAGRGHTRRRKKTTSKEERSM